MSSQSSDSSPRMPLPRSFWFAAAFLLFLLCSWIAFRQEPYPDAYWRSDPLHADWWVHPMENDAPRRLPRVWADFKDVFALKRTGYVWVIGDGGLILHSRDYGRHWTRQYLVDPKDPARDRPIGFKPDGWCCTYYELFQSSQVKCEKVNGNFFTSEERAEQACSERSQGSRLSRSRHTKSRLAKEQTLTLRDLANSNLYSVHFVDDQYGWIAGDNGTLFDSRDGGRTWFRRDTDGGRASHRGVFFEDHQTGVTIDQDWAAWVTSNGGSTWSEALPQDQSARCWGNPTYGRLLCTSDRARDAFHRTNAHLPPALSQSGPLRGWPDPISASHSGNRVRLFSNLNPASVFFLDQNTGWAVGGDRLLMRTKDGGRTWSVNRLRTRVDLRAVIFSDLQHGWLVGAEGALLATANGGETWQRLTRRLPPQASPAQGANLARSWRFPAPWYYLSLCVVGLLFIPALRRPLPRLISESAEELLVSDQPISTPSSDKFDFTTVALGLSRFLRNEKTLPPLTIAITGEWGTGKSSLMNLLRDDLKRYGFRPVWFNAWHHQKEENLLASLLETIRVQAIPPWWRPEGAIFRLRLLSIRWSRFWPVIMAILLVFSISLGYFWSHPQQLSKTWDAIQEIAKSPTNWLNEASRNALALLCQIPQHV